MGRRREKRERDIQERTGAPYTSPKGEASNSGGGPSGEIHGLDSLLSNLGSLSHQEARNLIDHLIEDTTSSSLTGQDPIQRLGILIDLSDEVDHENGIRAAIKRGEMLLAQDRSPREQALLHYFVSNAWESARTLSRKDEALEDWEQPELEQQIIHLRHAVRLAVTGKLSSLRRCQILTNLGNLMSHCGRLVDAVAYWDDALSIDSNFPMALGNRGSGLLKWAGLNHDPGHQIRFIRDGYRSLKRALASRRKIRIHDGARRFFEVHIENVERLVPTKLLRVRSHSHQWPKRMARSELEYRTWCLVERLFLNDLNELGPDPIGAADVLSLPGITTSIHSGPPNAIGFFNQLKQEYVTARYMYYEGINSGKAHFSDRDVTLVNTLDYPAYGLPVEQVKISFRIAYSILDKVAYFVNDYLALQIPERRVSFRSLWYERQERARGLRKDIHLAGNWPLKGLFWLAKDLYENDPGFTEAIEPDGQEVAETRNHIEHKYFKLTLFAPPVAPRQGTPSMRGDVLARSMDRLAFEAMTLRLLRTARSALINVALGIFAEEGRRAGKLGPVSMPMELTLIEDEWKF
jgi:hypothetical protein